MRNARSSEGILAAPLVLRLIALAMTGRYLTDRQLLDDFCVQHPGTRARAICTLEILRAERLLSEETPQLHASCDAREEHEWTQLLGSLTCQLLLRRMRDCRVPGVIRRMPDSGALWVDSLLLPGAAQGLPLWIVGFGVASRSSVLDRLWKVSSEFEGALLSAVRDSNAAIVQKKTSSMDFKQILEIKEKHGEEAEKWVLDFEKRRLHEHPLVDQIRRASDLDVGAGFDIVSFSSQYALEHDLFIEVKSVTPSCEFYWTANEIERAAALGESYSLYLVDRSKLHSVGYRPRMIAGPYSALIEAAPPEFSRDAVAFKCRLPVSR